MEVPKLCFHVIHGGSHAIYHVTHVIQQPVAWSGLYKWVVGTNENSYGHALLQSQSRPLMKTRSLERTPPQKAIGFAPLDTWDYCHCRKTRTMSDIDGSSKGKSKLTILDRFEAHLFAQSYNQKHGIDLDELFSPVARLAIIRTVIALSTLLDLDEHQLDVKNAFLSGSLDDEITMRQPEGYVNKKHPDYVCKLERTIMDCDNVFV